MPVKQKYDAAFDKKVERYLREGKTWSEISQLVGVKSGVVYQRMVRTLGLAHLAEIARQNEAPKVAPDAHAIRMSFGISPLPAGHPLTMAAFERRRKS